MRAFLPNGEGGHAGNKGEGLAEHHGCLVRGGVVCGCVVGERESGPGHEKKKHTTNSTNSPTGGASGDGTTARPGGFETQSQVQQDGDREGCLKAGCL